MSAVDFLFSLQRGDRSCNAPGQERVQRDKMLPVVSPQRNARHSGILGVTLSAKLESFYMCNAPCLII